MAVAKQNLTVYQGADFRRVLDLKDESNTAMDLTGYVFRGQARTDYSASTPSLTFEFTLRDQTTETGKVDMRILAADTSLISISKKTKYIYDIEMVNPDDIVTRIIEGSLDLIPEVTK